MITQKSMVIEKVVESGLKIGKAWLKAPPEQKIQQILVAVDPANDCRASIEHAIGLASIFGSTVALAHFYQEPYVLEGSLHSRHCDVFKMPRRQVFAELNDLLRRVHCTGAKDGLRTKESRRTISRAFEVDTRRQPREKQESECA
jgi:hypothetical protein